MTLGPDLVGKTVSRFQCAVGHNKMWLWLGQGGKMQKQSNMEFWAGSKHRQLNEVTSQGFLRSYSTHKINCCNIFC